MKLSASLIKNWIECPLQTSFKEILGFPEQLHAKTAFGTCIHDALELYNKTGDVKAAKERFKLTWEDPSRLDMVIELWPSYTSWAELRQRGFEFIDKFHEENRWDKRRIVGVEHRFLIPFGEDFTLSGIVDYLEIVGTGKNKELRIVDLKTSSYRPTALELRFNVQMTLYWYASMQPEFWSMDGGDELYEETKDMKRKAIWYAIWHNKTLDVGPRDEGDFMRLHRVCQEIKHAIEAEVYVPNISGSSCGWCSYTNICGTTIPLAKEVELARAARL